MKARYINELAEGTRVDSTFLVVSKQLRVARTGDEYLALELADRSGAVAATCFRPSAVAKEVPPGTVARVRGTVTRYRGRRRLTVRELAPAERWDTADLATSGARDTGEVMTELSALAKQVRDPALRALLREVYSDSDFRSGFRESPATRGTHHAYVGGLAEHTVAVARTCAQLCDTYLTLDRDMLMTAALLHDIGVVDALEVTPGIRETVRGRLLGHTVLGCQRLHEAARRNRLDSGVLARVEHAVCAHHGGGEAGGLIAPSTSEAMVLQRADGLDSTVASIEALGVGVVRAGEAWTDVQNPFGRPLCLAPAGMADVDAGGAALEPFVLRTA